MPFDSFQELKTSSIFQRSQALQSMSDRRLERFLRAFNAVHARVLRNGGGEEEAEKAAFVIAFNIAKSATFSDAPVESMRHFFSPMSPQMAGRDPKTGEISAHDLSFQVILEDREVADALVSGNVANVNHDRGEPAALIHGIIPVSEAPPEVQAATDPDTPFLVVASYFEDTPEDVRQIDTISAEWLTAPRPDGGSEALPFSFAVTRKPINGKELGVKRVASLDKPFKGDSEGVGVGALMGDDETPENELEAKVASLSEQLEKERESKTSFEERLASAEGKAKEVEDLKTKLASLLDAEPGEVTPEQAVADLGKKIASYETEKNELATKVASFEKEVETLKEAAASKEAEDWATGIAKEGKIAMDAIPKWASAYLKDPELTKEMVPSEAAFAPADDSKVANLHEALSGEQEDEVKSATKEVWASTNGGGN